ncbi:glyoxalase [Altererythrobacter halimionae]|uniref:Glyoxalase n=1 Tax=Alteriqipengyuania halimionae TaxID=1926630 RepID=A0A6I4U6K0_9SPHN|nr:glyoxalase [Alteriqipengyuania halimionae]
MRLDHLTILYTDRAASERHYDLLLPMIGFSSPKPGIWTDGDGFWLQFMQAEVGTAPYERYGAGLNHWGFAMDSAQAVEDLRQALIEGGLDVQPIQDLGGAKALFIPDPDGLRAEFTWYPEGVDTVG